VNAMSSSQHGRRRAFTFGLEAGNPVTQGSFVSSSISQYTDGLEGSLEGFRLVDPGFKGLVIGMFSVRGLT
jgi:hypothetical protein